MAPKTLKTHRAAALNLSTYIRGRHLNSLHLYLEIAMRRSSKLLAFAVFVRKAYDHSRGFEGARDRDGLTPEAGALQTLATKGRNVPLRHHAIKHGLARLWLALIPR